MNADFLFQWSNRLAMAGWILLIVLPRFRWTARLVTAVVIPAVLGVLYVFLAVRYVMGEMSSFGSLSGVSAMLQTPEVMLAGWLHYLAFDLFVGSWEVRDAQAGGISHLVVIPCLLLTFVLGPTGLLAYLILRFAWRRRIHVEVPAHA